jgi:carbon monoxide dehydrogenase subunit G
MRLENAFSVAAPIEDTWRTLLDIERVATCLPGATIEPSDADGVHRGAMRMKLGPLAVDYRGTARLQDVDEDTYSASIAVHGQEVRGQGAAAAVIHNHLEPSGEGTKVTAITELSVTGRQAQFGRGVMQDVATTMMQEFATRLELELQANGGPPPDSDLDDGAEPAPLDVGSVLLRAGALRYAAAAVGALALVVAIGALAARPRRRRLKFELVLDR